MEDMPVRVIRSTRRKKTVQATVVNGIIELRVPSRSSARDIEKWAEQLKSKLGKRRNRKFATDDELAQRAESLRRQYLPEAPAPDSIVWVTNQNSRWGSCSTETKRVRLSHRMKNMPSWVIDYVIVHELAHLLEANHSADFHRLVNRYPHTQKAQGFLEGTSWASREQTQS